MDERLLCELLACWFVAYPSVESWCSNVCGLASALASAHGVECALYVGGLRGKDVRVRSPISETRRGGGILLFALLLAWRRLDPMSPAAAGAAIGRRMLRAFRRGPSA